MCTKSEIVLSQCNDGRKQDATLEKMTVVRGQVTLLPGR